MDRVTIAKAAFALAGIGIFAVGAARENGVVRWVGIAFVVVAFLLRFAKKRGAADVTRE
jgi:hypothetical protein